jgi:hypothetical protein
MRISSQILLDGKKSRVFFEMKNFLFFITCSIYS